MDFVGLTKQNDVIILGFKLIHKKNIGQFVCQMSSTDFIR